MIKTEETEETEIKKFSAKADEWWCPNGAFKTLHDINPTRLQFITQTMSLNGLHVLDIGCGGGILTEAMAKLGANATGVDASTQNINIAKTHAANAQLAIDYVVSDVKTHVEQHQQHYDLITCMELLEHVQDPITIIQACAKMVKPGGHVIFSTINRSPKAYLLAIITAEYLLQLLPKGTHHYQNFIRPSELIAWCKTQGLTLHCLAGLHYNPILKHCRLNADPSVNYLVDTIAGHDD